VAFTVEGIVVEGDHRGRELGYPTANVAHTADEELPDDGGDAGTAQRPNGERYLAAISVGTRETFYASGGERLVEAYLLDFDGDLYGEQLRITLLEPLRSQRRFDGVEELIEQIRADVEEVRIRLAAKELTRSE
jgi:riboflavin kinase / FMN adenylyltransferase